MLQGRGGKGSIYVWATGNGGSVGDDCSCDGYVSSIYTLSVGCISDHGLSTYFSEVCPSTIAVVFTGGSHQMPGEADYKAPKIKVVCVFSSSLFWHLGIYGITHLGNITNLIALLFAVSHVMTESCST